jgi:CRISPR-associated endonuclease/helicase Cas3
MHAHTHPDFPTDPSRWEPLFTPFGVTENQCQRETCEKCRLLEPNHGHLNKVAWWTAKFASEMFAPDSPEAKSAWDWGYLAGLWHDLGKFAPIWQTYLKSKVDPHTDDVSGKVDHSTAGAQHSFKHSPFGPILSYLIAGHHSGLLDASAADGVSASLESRMKKAIETWSAQEITDSSSKLPPPPLNPGFPDPAHQVAVFARMAFSALVDADFLATESFMSPLAADDRSNWPDDILVRMADTLDRHIAAFNPPDSQVNQQRKLILESCRNAAANPPGLFTLSVPTGGGKTLSSLAFALRHAQENGLRRVIYVIPFTTIIEQNADVFRRAFADLIVEFGHSPIIEHHSNLDPKKDTTLNRLASENWDAPLIITTNVQFFESLFAARTSQCRKLHRIARSVVIFDEAQTLPVSFLKPCLSALRTLLHDYGSTLVLCTATQPAITYRDDFKIGLPAATEIIPDVPKLFDVLTRTTVTHIPGKLSDADLLARLTLHERSLLIVNTRRHASELFTSLGDAEGNFHLSAQMCPEHRSATIREIRCRLANGSPCRVISTQLIEAGVDLDFPVVYRSLAGLDSIAQAAGRCNREGLLESHGQVFVFESELPIPAGHLRQTADTARPLLSSPDLLSPDTIRTYFENHYWKRSGEWDARQILDEFTLPNDLLGFNFRTVAEKFRLIDQEMPSVLVPHGDEHACITNALRFGPFPGREIIRKAQRLVVQLHPNTFSKLLSSGAIRPIDDEARFHELTDPRLYHPKLGLLTDPEAFYSAPENLIS